MINPTPGPAPLLGRGADGKIDKVAGKARHLINFPEHSCTASAQVCNFGKVMQCSVKGKTCIAVSTIIIGGRPSREVG